MAEMDDALAAYHRSCIILRDKYLDAGQIRASAVRFRAQALQNAVAAGESITAARELADGAVVHLTHDLHVIDSEIQAELATLRWLDQLVADLRARPQ